MKTSETLQSELSNTTKLLEEQTAKFNELSASKQAMKQQVGKIVQVQENSDDKLFVSSI
jgi:hypothetical protein